MAKEYDGKYDAEQILENIILRRNWSVGLRDNLANALINVHYGKPSLGRPEPMRRAHSTTTYAGSKK